MYPVDLYSLITEVDLLLRPLKFQMDLLYQLLLITLLQTVLVTVLHGQITGVLRLTDKLFLAIRLKL